MSQTVAPPIPSLVPETAPFSDEQRRKVFGENALALFGIDASGRRR